MREVVELVARVAELERRVTGMIRHGTVAEVDPEKGRVRIKLGQDEEGGDFLSPWVPYSQLAGAIKAHVPPAAGQQFSLIAPTGDWQQAVAMPLTWSNANGSPSTAGDENVVTYGNVRITLKADYLEVCACDVVFRVSCDGIFMSGGTIRHNGHDIGASHRHPGVVRGGDITDPPIDVIEDPLEDCECRQLHNS